MSHCIPPLNYDVAFHILHAVKSTSLDFYCLSLVNRLFGEASLHGTMQSKKKRQFKRWRVDTPGKRRFECLPNGQYCGFHEEYWDYGMKNPKELTIYDEWGRKNGVQREWWSNGKIRVIEPYKNDMLEGHVYRYNNNGVCVYGGLFRLDKRYGTHWHLKSKDNQLELISYLHDERHGTMRVCDFLRGHLLETIEYQYGKRCGYHRKYHPIEGTLLSKKFYQDGRKHGTHFEWNRSGVLLREENYHKGFKHGHFKIWGPWGIELKESTHYRYGRLDGEQVLRSGKRVYWFRGKLVEETTAG